MKTDSGNKLDEKLSDVLSRAVLSETESSFAAQDDFKNWLEEGTQRQHMERRRKIRRAGLAAAVFLCAVLLTGSLLLSDALPPSLQGLLGAGEGVAVPETDSDIHAESGNLVIGGDGNGNVGTWTATVASYDDIPEKYREQIVWFEEIPEGYELVEILIIQNLNDITIVQKFVCYDEKELIVKQMQYDGNKLGIIERVDEEITIGNKTVHLRAIDDAITYVFLEADKIVFLLDQANLEKEKIEAMFASIKTGWSM